MFDLPALRTVLAAHPRVARVVIAAHDGSCPREVGASMLVWGAAKAGGGQSGTIGGGAMEWQAVQTARARLIESAPLVTRLALGPSLGQCCGGAVTLLTEVYDAASLPEGPLHARSMDSSPMPLAVKLLLAEARAQGRLPVSQLLQGWMIEPLSQPRRHLWLWGAGHVGRAIAAMLAPLPGLQITWIDVATDRFPDPAPEGVILLPAADPAQAVRLAPKDADHLIVTFPNYGTNLETPRAIQCEVTKLELKIETGWKFDLEQLSALVRPNTKLISLTTPHNPTGTCLSAADLTRVLEIAATVGAHVLVDETYRDMTFGDPTPHAASLSSKVISVSSLSKSYGLPGIRLGWLMTGDAALMQRFLAAKEQIFICGSSLDEEVAFQVMQRQAQKLEAVKIMLETNLSVLREWIAGEPRLEWIEPSGGCVCFPHITADVNLETFYKSLLETHGTYVGPGHWFGMSDSYFRLGFGWATLEQMKMGLQGISRALDDAAL